MTHKGIHLHRFKDNPEEERFAEAWENFAKHGNLEYLLGKGDKRAIISDRDSTVSATVVQWLGSPVGQGFLESLGYTKKGKDGTER